MVHRRHRNEVLRWLVENVAALRAGPKDYGYKIVSPTYINTAAQMAEWRAVNDSWQIIEAFPDGGKIRVYCADLAHATFIALKWS